MVSKFNQRGFKFIRSLLLAEQKNLTLHVYDKIKEMMFNYEIVPGQRLVFIDLAKALDVSRTPVNNALSILAKEGYLDFVPNQGYSVHKLTLEEAKALYDMKNILETGSISKAIRNASPEQLAVVEEKKSAFERSAKKRVTRSIFIMDMGFHAAICAMAGNPLLVEKYKDIYQHIFLRLRTEMLLVERSFEIIKEHNQIYESIRISDVSWAKSLIRQHNLESINNLAKSIFSN